MDDHEPFEHCSDDDDDDIELILSDSEIESDHEVDLTAAEADTTQDQHGVTDHQSSCDIGYQVSFSNCGCR